MRPERLNPIFAEVAGLKGVGPQLARPLEKLGLTRIRDLAYHLPDRFVERRAVESLDEATVGDNIVVALTPVWRRVSAALGQQGWKRRLVVVMIRNGQKPPACEQPDARGPEKRCILPPRLALSLPADLAHPTLRRNWGLYVDALGPLVAVLNVSGIGAHGRHAAADLLAAADQPPLYDAEGHTRAVGGGRMLGSA